MQTTTDDNIKPGPIDQHQLAIHRYQCHHIFPDGARCGSPALRNETRCYYHHETRQPVSNPRDRNARMNTFELPFPDSRTPVQSALGDLMVRIASNDIDPRRAGLLLYCLQLAQANLKASEIAHQQTRQTTPEISAPTAAIGQQVQTGLSCFEDFAQKSGEGEETESSHDEGRQYEAPVPHPSRAKGGTIPLPREVPKQLKPSPQALPSPGPPSPAYSNPSPATKASTSTTPSTPTTTKTPPSSRPSALKPRLVKLTQSPHSSN